MRWGRSRGRRGSGKSKRITVLFVTDLHGSEYTFRKLLSALEIWSPDVLIGGGDVAGKAMLPMLKQGDTVRVRWMGEDHRVQRDQLDEWTAKASQLGLYPYLTDEAELAAMRADRDLSDAIFERLMVERWADWLERLDARCAELELPAYVIAGNDDPWSLDEATGREREWVRSGDGRVLEVADDWKLLSCGLANRTPWSCPRDVSEQELEQHLAGLADEAGELENVIANIHVPPYGTSLDIAPRLDTSVSPPRAIAGETTPVGSTAVAEFLTERQPLLSLHGHIHESPGAVEIGRTHAINPGSEYAEGVLRAVLVVIERDRVRGHQFVTG